ncbi:MAG TPA: SH3 domain-containing protein [Thermodesulfobacteriota bacterium]|nr:SH3 domain-containing protein [Thermodesulfobacteriota bacterium]
MVDKNGIEDMVGRELNRLSHDFEVDLIRLLKTLSLLSQSKSILEKHTEYIRGRSSEFQNRLSGFIVTLLELEREIGELPGIPAGVGKEPNDGLSRQIERLKAVLRDCIGYAREMNDDLEKTSGECINSLDLVHRFYTLELQSTQIELDSRLKGLENSLSRALAEASALERKTASQKPEEYTQKGAYNIGETPIRAPKKPLVGFSGRNKGVVFGLFLILVSLIFGLWILDNRKETEGIGIRSGSEAVPSMEILEKGDVQLGKEEKRRGEDKMGEGGTSEIGETHPTAREEVQEPLFRKKPLTVIGPGAYIRGGAGMDYPIFSEVKSGEVFERLDEERGNWIKIKTRDGTVGWISKKVVREIEE